MTRAVIAGVDGSSSSIAAAVEAADLAARRHLPLRLLHGYLHAMRYGISLLDPYLVEPPPPSEAAVSMLDQVARDVRTRHPSLDVTVEQVAGGGVGTLLAASSDAAVVVVGSRGHGGFSGLLLGSVSAQVAAHAKCPVLVVRPGGTATGPVLVGIDGSEAGAEAASWAASEAALRGTTLVVVFVWCIGRPAVYADTYAETEKAVEAAAEAILSAEVERIRQAHPALAVEPRLVHGLDPDSHLVRISREATLAVVGSRGRGGFTGLLLGSVSQTLLHHAGCPVLVVR